MVNTASSKSLGEIALTMFVTGAVFWLAHVYANVLERRLRARRRLTRAEIREELDEEWPLVGVGVLPMALLAAGALFDARRATMLWVVTIICLAELALVGIVIGRRSGYGVRDTLVVVLANLAMGLVVVSLKVLVH